MPEQSTASPPPVRFLTVSEAAERLETSDEVVHYFIARRRISAMRIGHEFRIRTDVLDVAVQERDVLIGELSPALARDWQVSAFSRPQLTPAEIAAFFGVGIEDVRRLIKNTDWEPDIEKSRLWALIVAGAEATNGTLSEFERRLSVSMGRRGIAIRPAVKAVVRERDQDRCRYCGRLLRGDRLYLDHVVPKIRGGPHDPSNLVVCCRPCNSHKRDRLPHEAGMRLLLPATHVKSPGRRRKLYRPLPPPEVDYSILVMGT